MAAPDLTPAALLRSYLAPHRGRVGALTVALVAATALPLAGPQLLARFIDQAVAGRPLTALLGTAAAYLAVALSGQVVTVIATWLGSRLAWTAANRLREDLAAHVLGLDLGWHGRHTAGELIERVDGDVTALATFVSQFLFQVVGSVLLLGGAIVLVLLEDERIGLTLVVFLLAAGVLVWRLQRAALPAAEAEREAVAQVMGNLEERLHGAEEIRALGAADHVLRRFHEVNGEAYRASFRWELRAGGALAVTNLTFAAGTALLLALAVVLYRRGAVTVGTIVLLFQYTAMVRRPLEQLLQQFKEVQKALAGASRVVQLLRVRPAVVEAPQARPLPDAGALGVRLHHVTFGYPGDDAVLHDVSLALAPGRSIGLVGRTGSGKTTVARLLLRLYDPSDGTVEVGGVDLRDASLESLRRRVRLVTQDVQLFGASLRDNLTLFQPGTGDGHLTDVLDELGLGDWYRSLPDGLDTMLGPGGAGVSAGEAQLLAFARVFLADPGLIVLDEASSRLDPATERLVERAVDRLLTGRTAVLIAHRLSSLERVDEVAVLDEGRLVEHGNRAELAADPDSHYGRLRRLALGGVRP